MRLVVLLGLPSTILHWRLGVLGPKVAVIVTHDLGSDVELLVSLRIGHVGVLANITGFRVHDFTFFE